MCTGHVGKVRYSTHRSRITLVYFPGMFRLVDVRVEVFESHPVILETPDFDNRSNYVPDMLEKSDISMIAPGSVSFS